MVNPVLGDIAVDERIACDVGKFEVEDQPQGERCKSNQEKVPWCLPDDGPKRRSLDSNCRITVQHLHFAKYNSSIGTTPPPELRDDFLAAQELGHDRCTLPSGLRQYCVLIDKGITSRGRPELKTQARAEFALVPADRYD